MLPIVRLVGSKGEERGKGEERSHRREGNEKGSVRQSAAEKLNMPSH